MKRWFCLLGMLVPAMWTGAQSTAPTTMPAAPGPYTLLRYDEDYSYLRDPSLRTDPFDNLKFIPLNSEGDWYLTLGGQVRDRYEFFNHNTFGAGPQDKDGYDLIRVMANVDVHLGPHVRLFAQGISASELGREGGPRPTDVNIIDLHQGFGDFIIPICDDVHFTARAGRQNLLFGVERLIGPLDWANVRRTFDGFRGTLSSPGNDLDLFFVRPVVVNKYKFDNDSTDEFAGIYDDWQLPGAAKMQVELYGLYLRRQNATSPTEGKGREDRYTAGLRVSGHAGAFNFDVEPDYQFGEFHNGDIHAWSVASELGYTIDSVAFTPRVFIGFDAASGDHNPHNGSLGTFNQLFPTSHLYFGYIDVIARQNIIDLHPGAELLMLKGKSFARKLTLKGEYHQFWRESDHDALYNAPGTVLRASGTSTASSIGSELDLLLNWQIDRHASAYAGYSHFFAGRFLEQTGAHRDIDFFYAAVTYTF